MGRLYDLIKKEVEELKAYTNSQNNDFSGTRKFGNVYQAHKNKLTLRALTSAIENNAKQLFGSNANFKKILEDNIGPENYSIPVFDFDKNVVFDYEKFLNKLEESLDDAKIKIIEEKFNNAKNDYFARPTHPFDSEIKNTKEYVDSLTDEDMSKEEREEIKRSLDYANNMLVKKHGHNYVDEAIDIVAVTRDRDAKAHLNEFANQNNIDLNRYTNSEKSIGVLQTAPSRPELNDMIKPLLNNFVMDPNFVNKIKTIDKMVRDNDILKVLKADEQSNKEYAFNDWFIKARALKNELYNYTSNPNATKEEKIASLRRINTASKSLEEITNKYNNVLDFIKENFDITKISLPTNIYAGRPSLDTKELSTFNPDLPEIYDYENAPYGVILSCYSIVKGLCQEGNMTIDEFLENPIKSFIEICNRKIESIDNRFALPRNGNSLGKRMAHVLIQPAKPYYITASLTMASRNLELVTNLTEDNENTRNNTTIALLGGAYSGTLDRSCKALFEYEKSGISNLMNLFALGDTTDNLLTLSDKFLSRDLVFDDLKAKYDNQIRSLANRNPIEEYNRVMQILKDYFIERKAFYDNPNFVDGLDDEFLDPCKSGIIFVAAKKYFQDYLFKNDINLNNLSDADRNKIIELSENPTAAFEREMQGQPNVFIEQYNENFDEYTVQFAYEFRRIHEHAAENFVNGFVAHNNTPNGYNVGKDIPRILEDNKGGIWERYIARSTSPEYKALVRAVNNAKNIGSASYDDIEPIKYYAKKYLDHKLINNNPNKLNETGKKRVEFAKTILKSLNDYDEKKYELHANNRALDIEAPRIVNRQPGPDIIVHNQEVTINQPLNDIKEPKITNNIDLNEENFHKMVKEKMSDNVEVEIDNVTIEENKKNLDESIDISNYVDKK